MTVVFLNKHHIGLIHPPTHFRRTNSIITRCIQLITALSHLSSPLDCFTALAYAMSYGACIPHKHTFRNPSFHTRSFTGVNLHSADNCRLLAQRLVVKKNKSHIALYIFTEYLSFTCVLILIISYLIY